MEEELLYHYTSIVGLNGIISSRNLWASDCRYLNDQKELVHAIEIFLDGFESDTKEILSLALHWFSFSQAHCVFSLSRSPRVLSQWRAYGDDGHGAAIGFSRKYLPGIGNSSTRLLVDCIYSDHENFLGGVADNNKEHINSIIQMHADSGGAVNSFWDLIRENPLPLAKIYSELLRVKNQAFEEEQEVRLVISVPINKVKSRVANGLIIPYIEHSFVDKGDEDYIWCIAPEIWFGPKSDKRNMRAIQAFGQFGWGINGVHHYDCGYV